MKKEDRKKIMKYLKDKFSERGKKDFFFKSSKISKDLDLQPRCVGRIVSSEKKIEIVRGGKHGCNLYKTRFGV
jgi:hypothetical protein